jgi:catechol 2,3-dioxygenase-like lactoylglutathione lyase family enzyme
VKFVLRIEQQKGFGVNALPSCFHRSSSPIGRDVSFLPGLHSQFAYFSAVSLPTRFDHCVVHVSDWERSNSFYRDVVGVEIISKNGRWSYRFANAQLNLHGPGVQANPLAKIPVPPGGSDLCFEWSGPIEEAVDHLKAHSVEIELGPVQRGGARGDGVSIYFRDPDGSLLEFISYLG